MRRPFLVSLGLAGAAFAMRLAVAGRLPTEWDSVNLMLGVDRFDVRQDSPHAPGYWLYLLAGRLVRALTPFDTNRSLIIVAALASAAVVAMTYLAAREIAGDWVGLIAATLVATSPFLWFYGSVAATYSFDALVGIVLVFLAVRARPGSRHAIVAASVLGLAAGFRPTTVVMFAGVTLVVAVRSIRSCRVLAASAGAGAAALLVWVVPMQNEQPGGLAAWRAASNEIFYNAAKSTSLLAGSPQGWTNAGKAVVATAVAVGPALLVGAVAVLLRLLAGPRDFRPQQRSWISPVLLAAAVPGLLFVALTHFPKAGYAVAFVPPLVVLAVLPAARLGTPARIALVVVLALVGAGNVARFLHAPGVIPLSLMNRPGWWFTEGRYGGPFIVTRAEIRRVDALSGRYARIRSVIDPRSEVLVFDLGHAAGNYRWATWSLPEYRSYLIGAGTNWRSAWHRQQRFTRGDRITVPPGGTAVLTMDLPSPDIDQLIAGAEGLATKLDLPGGPELVRVRPGATLFGLPVVEGPPQPYKPSAPDRRDEP